MASHSVIAGVDSYTVNTLRDSSDTSSRIDRALGQWVIPGASYQASLPCDDMFIQSEPVRGSLFVVLHFVVRI